MPANTSQGLPYPLPTEPVAEGAQAIRNLAEGVDAFLAKRAMEKISELGAAVLIDFTSIPQTYAHLLIVASLRTDWNGGANFGANLRLNGDTAGNYDWQRAMISGAALTASNGVASTSAYIGDVPAASETVGYFAGFLILLPDYRSGNRKTVLSVSSRVGLSIAQVGSVASSWRGTAAVTRVTLLGDGVWPFTFGSKATLYGVR